MTVERTPVHIVAGSLGSGKTTMLRHLLASDLGRVAVLVNEFGEIGIDGTVLEGEHVRLVELPGGCVCCSLVGEFHAALRELLAQTAPDLIVVEATGVAEADALALDLEEAVPEIRIECVVVMVDADACARFPRLGYAERTQMEAADLLVLNKVDLVTPEQINEIRSRLTEVNDSAPIIEVCRGAVDPALINPSAGTGHGRTITRRYAHTRSITSFSWRPRGNLRRVCFEAAVGTWPQPVYRAKGWVCLDGTLYLFNYVAGRWDMDQTEMTAEPGLVWIGPGIDQLRETIIQGLEACRE